MTYLSHSLSFVSEMPASASWRRCLCAQPNWNRVFLASTSAENCAERRDTVKMRLGFPSEYELIRSANYVNA